MKKQEVKVVLIPALVLLVFTLLFRLTELDRGIEGLFYTPDKGWFLRDAEPWAFLYHYGNAPGIILAFLGLILFLSGFFYRRVSRRRKIGLFLCLVMVLGPGLVVNAAFKHNWGRPRPRQIQEFGGNLKYLPVWKKGLTGEGKSFPSGHASVGFYLFTPFFFLPGKRRKWGIFFLCLGMTYGLLMGVGRMVQGGHFPSDVLWAGGFTYLTGLVLSFFFRFENGKTNQRAEGR